MKQGQLWNQQTGQLVARQLLLADTFWNRFRGLLGRTSLQSGEGLWLKPCQQVHMIGMKFPLSVWFLDKTGHVLEIIDNLGPWQISPRFSNADSIIEFPVGWGEETNTHQGDQLFWKANLE